MTLADKIREFVKKNYIDPARKNGEQLVTVRASEVHRNMGLQNHFPSVCQALDSDKFIDSVSVVLSKRKGPPKSSSVVWTFDLLPNTISSIKQDKEYFGVEENNHKYREHVISAEIEPSQPNEITQFNHLQINSLRHLVNIGFEEVGYWSLDKDQVTFALTKSANESNIIYAFVVNDVVKYIGKSIQTLYKRIYLYKQGGGSQLTNIRIKQEIKVCLARDDEVKIYVLVPDLKIEYRGIPINLAAGLEDNIIARLKPEWNKR